MIEKEIESYYNARLKQYKNIIIKTVQEVIRVPIINGVIESTFEAITTIYTFGKGTLEFYRDEYNRLSVEEQNIIDYFEKKIGDKEEYLIGSSKKSNNNQTQEKHGYFPFDSDVYINAFTDPFQLYSADFIYMENLMLRILFSEGIFKHYLFLITGDIKKDMDIIQLLSRTFAKKTVDILHNMNIYIFDNKDLILEYAADVNEAKKSAYENGVLNCKDNENLLMDFADILPLFIFDREKFYEIVGKQNFLELISGYHTADVERVNSAIEKMKSSRYKNSNIEIIAIDYVTIEKALEVYRDRKMELEPEQLPVCEEKTIVLNHSIKENKKGKISLLGKTQPIYNKDYYDFNLFDKHSLDMYIDENGNDTLENPSKMQSPKR